MSTTEPSLEEQLDLASHGDDKPQKRCEYVGDYTGEQCGDRAEKAVWVRHDSRVNDHGVHITTEVRPVFVCEEHDHCGDDVPDANAKVVTRNISSDGDNE